MYICRGFLQGPEALVRILCGGDVASGMAQAVRHWGLHWNMSDEAKTEPVTWRSSSHRAGAAGVQGGNGLTPGCRHSYDHPHCSTFARFVVQGLGFRF